MKPLLAEIQSSWRPPVLRDLPSWAGAERVGLDIETYDPGIQSKLGIGVRRGGFIAGISFAIEDGPCAYLPIRHGEDGDDGDNLPIHHVLQYIKDQAAAFSGDLVGANLSYDLDYLAEEGIWFGDATIRDVQIAEPLIDELQMKYNLERIAKKYKLPGKDEKHLKYVSQVWGTDLKGGLWSLPARHVGAYAEYDAKLPLALLARQEAIIEEEGLREVWDLESAVLPVLVKMRRRGVRVNLKQLEKVEELALREEDEALAFVRSKTKSRIQVGDVWKARLTVEILKELGVPIIMTAPTKRFPKGQPCTKNDVLKAAGHPVTDALLRARRSNKIRTTFVESIRKHTINDRIHCTFNQLKIQKDEGSTMGAAYGRLSSVDPNLQQQPIRDETFGKIWRAIFLPDEGSLWASNDYSQQEPRQTVHYAATLAQKGVIVGRAAESALNAMQQFIDDPGKDFHQMMADMAGVSRKEAKSIFLGLCYGMGSAKLARTLGLPTKWIRSKRNGKQIEIAGEEGEALFQKFHAYVPFVQKLSEEAKRAARLRGYIKTMSGRRCRFPEKWGRIVGEHKALNRLIQGSSADQTKRAMVEADRAGFALQLQVHDELDLSVSCPGVAWELAEIMENCIQLKVPSKVDTEIGPNWGDIKEMKRVA